jgi:dephospho-CoA kinase
MSIIIALVGFGSSGKDAVARYLVKNFSFKHISSGDLIREHVVKNNLGDCGRENLQSVANDLRSKFGADYLARLGTKEEKDNLIISGLRAIPEIEYIKSLGGFIVAIDAPVESRYKWSINRGRSGEIIALDKFIEIENKESVNLNHNNQNIRQILSIADFTIVNNSDLTELFYKASEVAKKIIDLDAKQRH